MTHWQAQPRVDGLDGLLDHQIHRGVRVDERISGPSMDEVANIAAGKIVMDDRQVVYVVVSAGGRVGGWG